MGRRAIWAFGSILIFGAVPASAEIDSGLVQRLKPTVVNVERWASIGLNR